MIGGGALQSANAHFVPRLVAPHFLFPLNELTREYMISCQFPFCKLFDSDTHRRQFAGSHLCISFECKRSIMDVNTHTYIMLLDMKGSMTLPSGCYAQTPIVLDV